MPANNPLAYLTNPKSAGAVPTKTESSTGRPTNPPTGPAAKDPETTDPGTTDPEKTDPEKDESSTEIPKKMIDALIQQESGGDPQATSPVGAEGTAQVMPNTQQDPGYGVDPIKNPRDRQEARRFANEYLGAMMAEFDNPEHALMAYNWGPGNVKEWKRNGADPSEVPDETKGYVRNLLPVAAKAMNMSVESTIMGKQVGDKEREQARKARQKMREEKVRELAVRASPDNTRVAAERPSKGPTPPPAIPGDTMPDATKAPAATEGPFDFAGDGQLSDQSVPPPPTFNQTNIPPNQTQ